MSHGYDTSDDQNDPQKLVWSSLLLLEMREFVRLFAQIDIEPQIRKCMNFVKWLKFDVLCDNRK